MRRVTVTLNEKELRLLARMGRATGESRSQLVRRAVQRTYATVPTHEERIAALLATAGAWKADHAPA